MDKFNDILGELATYYVEVPDNEKASKLLHTPSESFALLAMALQMTDIIFDKLFNAVDGEMSRPKKQHKKAPMTTLSSNQAFEKHRNTWRGSGAFRNEPGDGRMYKTSNSDYIDCYVRERWRHRAQYCWYMEPEPLTAEDVEDAVGEGTVVVAVDFCVVVVVGVGIINTHHTKEIPTT